MTSSDKKNSGEKLISTNKNASRNYQFSEKTEAGIVLKGTEVKAIREGGVHLNDAYATIEKGEIFLLQMSISPYSHGNQFNHEPLRSRKLLLHKEQIRKLTGAVVEKGFTLIPTRLYWSKGKVKVELALAKGKTKGDRREDVKRRTDEREIDRAIKKSR